MVQLALDRGYEVVGVCRQESVAKLDAFKGRMTVVPGATNDAEVIKRAVAGCDGVLVVLAPRGTHQYASGTAQAVLRRRSRCALAGGAEPGYLPLRTEHGARLGRSRSQELDAEAFGPGRELVGTVDESATDSVLCLGPDLPRNVVHGCVAS